MSMELTTGVPGAGKTLYTVAEVLKPLTKATIEIDGRSVKRRLCIAGIPDLLLPHELVEAKQIPPEGYADPYGDIVRRPGYPVVTHVQQRGERFVACAEDDDGALPLPRSVENWWLWVEPGDVVVIDECQTVFRPMPAGRRAPAFIRHLETHRHYGIDFVLITQHPQLIHSAVRALIGQHRHVRRLFGRRGALIYEWDHCSPPDRVKTASTRPWMYKKAAFGLYKSAQLHTKQRWGTSWPLVLGLCAFLALPFLWWRAISGTANKGADLAASPAASAAVVGVAPPAASTAPAAGRGHAQAAAAVSVSFPLLDAVPVVVSREPYAGRGIQIEGGYVRDGKPFAVFGLVQDGKRIATLTLNDLVSAGYAYTVVGPCAGLLRFGDQERVLSCGARVAAQDDLSMPSRPASGPASVI